MLITRYLAIVTALSVCSAAVAENYAPRDYSIVPPSPRVAQFFELKDYEVIFELKAGIDTVFRNHLINKTESGQSIGVFDSIDNYQKYGAKSMVNLRSDNNTRGRLYYVDVLDNNPILREGVRDVSTPYYQEAVGRFPAGEYTMTHDLCGRLTTDSSRGIQSVSYHDWSNLPKMIKLDDNQYVNNRYLPDGTLMNRSFRTKRIVTHTRVDQNGDTIVTNRRRDYTVVHNYTGSFERVNGLTSYLRINTPTGYWDSRTNSHYWHITDRLGSVTAVIDSAGNVVQRTGYYPSGTPYILPPDLDQAQSSGAVLTMTPASDRLHIGNRWMSHCGLNWYDNTARMHDPILMRFTTPDPLYGKYPDLSPWSHCAANPVNAIDQNGMDVYQLNEDGTFSFGFKFRFADIIMACNNDMLILKNGTIESGVTGHYQDEISSADYSYYVLNENGFNEFKFFAEHTNVEWDRILFRDEKSIIGTSNSKYEVASGAAYFNKYSNQVSDVIEYDHTHPTDIEQSGPDIKLAKWLESRSPNIKLKIFISNDFNISYTFNSNSIPAIVYSDGDEVMMDGITITASTHQKDK